MNDFSELEAELKQLRPVAPSTELVSRIETALAQAPAGTATGGVLPRPKVRVNWFALGFGIAAAAAFVLLARVDGDKRPQASQPLVASAPAPAPAARQPQPAAGLVPDGVTRVVYNRRDEGLVFPEEAANQPVRRVRSRTRETLQWRDESTGASLRVSYPAEEVEFIPVSGQ